MIVSTATNRVTHSRVAHSQTRQNTPCDLPRRQTFWHRLVAQSTLGGLGLLVLSDVAAFGHGDSQPDVIGHAHPYQMGMQEAVTPVMQELRYMHDNILMPIIVAVTIVVTGLLAYACWRFRESRNPTPSRTTHHTMLEVVWTAVPVLILVVIAIPSFRLLYNADVVPESDMTLKIVGRQWYWSYSYPDHNDINFDSLMLSRDESKAAGGVHLLEVDNVVVLPVNTTIRLQMTSSDVLHNWAVPAFGTKLDTVPGRLNETWIRVIKEGKYYGQCSELCGAGHGYMPIVVRVVSANKFEQWIVKQQAASGRPAEKVVAATN